MATEQPAVLILHYPRGRGWRDALVIQPSEALRIVDVDLTAVGWGGHTQEPSAEQKTSLQAALREVPHRALRTVEKYLAEMQSPSRGEVYCLRAVRAELHRKQDAAPLRGAFVVRLNGPGYREDTFLPGHSGIRVVHIDVQDLRGTTRVSHFDAIEKAKSLPPSLQQFIRTRLQSWRSALPPADRGKGVA